MESRLCLICGMPVVRNRYSVRICVDCHLHGAAYIMFMWIDCVPHGPWDAEMGKLITAVRTRAEL